MHPADRCCSCSLTVWRCWLGVPISFALLLSSLLVIWIADLPTMVMVQQMFTGINAFTLLALPFFFLAGNVMNDGGISERLVKLAMALVGHFRGGLAHVNVVVGMFISGISGSSTADAAAIGTIFCPAMKRRGYDERFAVCLTACTSTMGAVIPPSILMVVYGATAGVSIGALLIGGILPGVLMGLSLMVQSHFFALKYDFPREHPQVPRPARGVGRRQGRRLAARRAGDHRRRHGGRRVHADRIRVRRRGVLARSWRCWSSGACDGARCRSSSARPSSSSRKSCSASARHRSSAGSSRSTRCPAWSATSSSGSRATSSSSCC